MKYRKLILTLIFAMFLSAGAFATSASAQTDRRVVQRPVIVRRYIVRDPFWRYRYWRSPYWGYSGFYDPYWYSPTLRYLDQKYYLERQLQGNRRELQKHLEKYRADGYISPKERKELDDDYRDIRKVTEKLNRLNREYGRY